MTIVIYCHIFIVQDTDSKKVCLYQPLYLKKCQFSPNIGFLNGISRFFTKSARFQTKKMTKLKKLGVLYHALAFAAKTLAGIFSLFFSKYFTFVNYSTAASLQVKVLHFTSLQVKAHCNAKA
jgi:hypothetical protein